MDNRKSLPSSLGSSFNLERNTQDEKSILSSFESKVFTEETLKKEIQSIHNLANEVQEALLSLGKNVRTKAAVSNGNKKFSLLKEKMNKLIKVFKELSSNTNKKYKEDIKLLKEKVTHSIDRELIVKQKVNQIKAKYKLKKHEMEAELKNYRKEYERSKQIWTERQRILEQDIEVLLF